MADHTPGTKTGHGTRTDARRNTTAILEAAARLLAEDPGATIQQIADEAGVVRLTVYRRFRNREALRRAVFEAAATQVQEAVAAARTRSTDPATTLRLIIIAMATTAQRYPLIVFGDDLKPVLGQRGRPTAHGPTRDLHQTVFDVITRGQAEGTFRSDLRPEMFALAIVGTINTATRFATAVRLDGDRIGADVADLVLGGILATASARD